MICPKRPLTFIRLNRERADKRLVDINQKKDGHLNVLTSLFLGGCGTGILQCDEKYRETQFQCQPLNFVLCAALLCLSEAQALKCSRIFEKQSLLAQVQHATCHAAALLANSKDALSTPEQKAIPQHTPKNI